jgi:hypothetical protein
MKMKLMIAAALAAGAVAGSGIAYADPAPAPDPNGPKCWEPTSSGWLHTESVPCGWTYSDADGWQQLPPGSP